MNRRRVIFILIGIVFVSFGIGIFSLQQNGFEIIKDRNKKPSLDFIAKDESRDIDQEARVGIENIREIKVNAAIAKIDVIPEDRNDVHIHYHGYISDNIETKLSHRINKDKLEIIVENKNLTKINLGNMGTTRLYLDIYIPKNYSQDIKIKADLGDVHVADFQLRELDIDADLGNIKVSNIKAKEVDIDADLGNIEIKNIEAKEIELECDAGNIVAKDIKGDTEAKADLGNIELDYENFDYKIKAISNLGSITITLPKDSNFNLDAKSDLGSVTTDFPVTTTETSKNSLRGKVGNGGKEVALTVDLGSIKIKSR